MALADATNLLETHKSFPASPLRPAPSFWAKRRIPTQPHATTRSIPSKHQTQPASRSEARTTKGRHPERSEAELKDLHSPQPSTTHQEIQIHRQRGRESGQGVKARSIAITLSEIKETSTPA